MDGINPSVGRFVTQAKNFVADTVKDTKDTVKDVAKGYKGERPEPAKVNEGPLYLSMPDGGRKYSEALTSPQYSLIWNNMTVEERDYFDRGVSQRGDYAIPVNTLKDLRAAMGRDPYAKEALTSPKAGLRAETGEATTGEKIGKAAGRAVNIGENAINSVYDLFHDTPDEKADTTPSHRYQEHTLKKDPLPK